MVKGGGGGGGERLYNTRLHCQFKEPAFKLFFRLVVADIIVSMQIKRLRVLC